MDVIFANDIDIILLYLMVLRAFSQWRNTYTYILKLYILNHQRNLDPEVLLRHKVWPSLHKVAYSDLILKGVQEVARVAAVCWRGAVRLQAAACLSLRALKHKTFLGNRFREAQSVSRTEPSCFLWAVYWIKSSGQAHSSARCRWITEISSSFIIILLSPQDTELEENVSTMVITDSLWETAWLFHGLFFGGDPYDCPRYKVRITEIYV